MRRTYLHIPLLMAAMATGWGCAGEAAELPCERGSCSDRSDEPAREELLGCADREADLLAELQTLFDGLGRGERQEITSVDALLAALPEEVRKSFIFMTGTRSMAKIEPRAERREMLLAGGRGAQRLAQGPDTKWCSETNGSVHCVESRVIITSPQADFIGSFTTHPDSPAIDRFEMALFNNDRSEVDFFDIDFREGTASISKNPPACMACHQGDDGSINYRLDPYLMWPNATPFKEDHLSRGRVETEWYLAFLSRIEAGEERLRHLLPLASSEEMRQRIESDGFAPVTVPEARVNTHQTNLPLSNLSHLLLEKNACRSVASVARRPDFEQIKYATMGALFDCPDIESFLPRRARGEGTVGRDSYAQYFEALGEGLDADGDFSFDALLDEMRARHQSIPSSKLSRRFQHIAEFVGADDAFHEIEQSLEGHARTPEFGLTSFEDSSAEIAKTRYLLEALGVDVASWSLSVDRADHGHVDFFQFIWKHRLWWELSEAEFPGMNDGSTEHCEALAERSREMLEGMSLGENEAQAMSTVMPDVHAIEKDARNLVRQENLHPVIRTQAAKIYNRCVGCHRDAYEAGAPLLPYESATQLEEFLQVDAQAPLRDLDGLMIGAARGPTTFRYEGLADRIWDRVNRHPSQVGRMPRTGEGLTRGEKVMLYAHLLLSGARE